MCNATKMAGRDGVTISNQPTSTPGISKQAGDSQSSAGYLIICRWLLWSK